MQMDRSGLVRNHDLVLFSKDCIPIKGSPIIIIVEEDWQRNNISM